MSQKPLSVCIFVYTEEGRTEEWEGGRKEGRHQHNLVKQLYPQFKSIIKKKERQKQREKEGRKEGEEIPSFLNNCLPVGCFFLPALFSKRPVITLYHSRNERMWFSNVWVACYHLHLLFWDDHAPSVWPQFSGPHGARPCGEMWTSFINELFHWGAECERELMGLFKDYPKRAGKNVSLFSLTMQS